MIDKYPAALQHQDKFKQLPLHIECRTNGRLVVVSRCIELYPESLHVSLADQLTFLPLHSLLINKTAVECTLMLLQRCPTTALVCDGRSYFPIHFECFFHCRLSIVSKCIELCPESLDSNVFVIMCEKVNKKNFHELANVLSIIFTARPMRLYDQNTYTEGDIRLKTAHRRRILNNLLPRHVFTPLHESDYRDLNWQSRAAMITLLSQIKAQQGSPSNMML
jgi:hypothetical protein